MTPYGEELCSRVLRACDEAQDSTAEDARVFVTLPGSMLLDLLDEIARQPDLQRWVTVSELTSAGAVEAVDGVLFDPAVTALELLTAVADYFTGRS